MFSWFKYSTFLRIIVINKAASAAAQLQQPADFVELLDESLDHILVFYKGIWMKSVFTIILKEW